MLYADVKENLDFSKKEVVWIIVLLFIEEILTIVFHSSNFANLALFSALVVTWKIINLTSNSKNLSDESLAALIFFVIVEFVVVEYFEWWYKKTFLSDTLPLWFIAVEVFVSIFFMAASNFCVKSRKQNGAGYSRMHSESV